MIKYCAKCQVETERHARGQCSQCVRVRNAVWGKANREYKCAATAAWVKANPERSRAATIAWAKANPERDKANKAAYRAANPEKVSAANAAWRASNPEKYKATQAVWRAANPEKIKRYAASPERAKAYAVAYRAANPEKVKAAISKWMAAHPSAWRIYNQNRRARKLENGGKLSRGLSAKQFKLQRGKCPCCKKPLGEVFHLDHILPLARGGSNTDNNIQLLRASCNQQKSAKDPFQFMQEKGFLI